MTPSRTDAVPAEAEVIDTGNRTDAEPDSSAGTAAARGEGSGTGTDTARGPVGESGTGADTDTAIPTKRARPRAGVGSIWSSRALRLGSVVAAVLLWQLLTANDFRLWLRFDTLPTVTEIVTAFGRQLGTDVYYLDLAQSLIRILTGFAIATVLGVASGIALGRSRLFADILGPLTELARPVPAIAVVPIAILLFPDDEAGIVFITSLAAYFPIMVSTRHAVRALPTLWEDSVRTLGGSRWDVLVRVVFPGALPGIFGGLSVGIGVAWICLISAEMISGRLGVGYRTWQAYTIVDYPGVFVGIITIGVLGFATSAALELLGRRVTRWLPRGEENSR
ncbi:ABC transporter permease [Nocardia cyriacigeorgica]|uniref:ABC transporter permease n=1 Tax=Nocardia cyriacigeorgica TaxID=135487 RepID=UPI0024538872|nr:ABC transporter permease [Nocardia cyriacigeorgica]